MRIAYVVPYVPNLIRTRPYNLITHLNILGHEVVVFTVGANSNDYADAQLLEEKCSEVRYRTQPTWRSILNSLMTIPTEQPLQAVYSWHRGLAQEIVERARSHEFDLIHVEHLRGSRYGVFLKSEVSQVPVVWDSVDCISHLFQQASSQGGGFFGKFVTRFELSRTRRAESDLICRFDHVLVTSDTDRRALLDLVPANKKSSPITVLPNGVDLEYFQPNPDIQREADTLVFSGKMSYHSNISMVRYLVNEIMPRIWARHPSTSLLIVGKDPPPEIKAYDKSSQITVTGTVGDIRPFLWRATAAVVPLLYGAGIQNKILEAMATGTPVVTTSRPLSALRTVPGQEILVADTANEFADAVLSLIENKQLQTDIGNSGLGYVRRFHDWKKIAASMSAIYQNVIR